MQYVHHYALVGNTLLEEILRGYCTRNQKLACFVFYLKIINTFLKTDTCIL